MNFYFVSSNPLPQKGCPVRLTKPKRVRSLVRPAWCELPRPWAFIKNDDSQYRQRVLVGRLQRRLRPYHHHHWGKVLIRFCFCFGACSLEQKLPFGSAGCGRGLWVRWHCWAIPGCVWATRLGVCVWVCEVLAGPFDCSSQIYSCLCYCCYLFGLRNCNLNVFNVILVVRLFCPFRQLRLDVLDVLDVSCSGFWFQFDC